MKGQKTGTAQNYDPGMLLLGGVFLLGALAGSHCCARVPRVEALFLPPGQANGFWPVFWPDGVLMGLLFLAGLLRAGCLPVLGAVAVKGFLLAAQATGWVLALGQAGYGAAVCHVLLPGFLSLAAILLLSRQVLARRRLMGKKSLRPEGAFFLAAAICLVLAMLAASACGLSPRLWQWTQTFLTAQ